MLPSEFWLIGCRRANSMRRSILVGRFECVMNTICIFPGFSALGSLYDTSSHSYIEHCMCRGFCRQPLVFLGVFGSWRWSIRGICDFLIGQNVPSRRPNFLHIFPLSIIIIIISCLFRSLHLFSPHGYGNLLKGGFYSALISNFLDIARPGSAANPMP